LIMILFNRGKEALNMCFPQAATVHAQTCNEVTEIQ
jgi:hypothetical protein